MATSMLAQDVAQLAERLETRCRIQLEQLRAQVTQEASDFAAAATQIDAALDAIDSRIAEFSASLQERATDAQEHIAAQLGHLESHLAHAETETASRLEAIEQADEAIGGAADALMASLEATQSSVEDAAESLNLGFGAWIQATQQGITGVDATLDSLRLAATEFKSLCGRAADDLTARCAELSRGLDVMSEGLARDWMHVQAQLNQGTMQLLVGHVGGEFQGEVRRLSETLSALRRGGEGAASLLGGDAARMIHSVQEIGHLLAQIEPLLRIVDELA